MAIPDYFKNEVGSAITWKASGGTYAWTGKSVTNGNGRQGVKGDLGAAWARRWSVMLTSAVGSAATAGLEIELYWAPSDSATAGTNNPGGVSGTDATFNTTPSEYKRQLIPIGSLILSNNAGTGVQKQYFDFYPPTRYGSPVMVNSSGQTLSGTDADHTITMTPVEENVQDTM